MRLKKITTFILAGVIAASTVLTGCGSAINEKAVGATINGEEISLGLMNFMAKYQQASTDGYALAYFGTEMWSSDLYGDGTTMEDSTKTQVAEGMEKMYLLEDHMSDYKVEITKDDLAAIEEAAKKFMSDNSKKAISQVGATEEYVKEMLRLFTIESKMRQAIYAKVDTKVTDEEAAQRTFSYVKIDSNGKYDEENKFVDYTEDEKKAVKKTAEDFAAAAKKDFEGEAEKASYTVTAYSYGKEESAEEDAEESESESGTMDKAVIKAADALKEGKVSDLITTEDAYYVIRLDSAFDKEATEKEKESIITKRQTDYYNEICDGYKKDAEFEINEKEWKKVKFDKLFSVAAPEEEATDEGTEDKATDEDTEDKVADENTEDKAADEDTEDKAADEDAEDKAADE